MKATIKGITGYIKKMKMLYSYCQDKDLEISNIHNTLYIVTLLQDDGTEIKFTNIYPEEIKMEATNATED